MFEFLTRYSIDTSELSLDNHCELEILNEKQHSGRVSTITMKHLRKKYGKNRANRAMYRLQKKIKTKQPGILSEFVSSFFSK
jgi:hypothetical protein